MADRLKAAAEKAAHHTTAPAHAIATKAQEKVTPKAEVRVEQQEEVQVADRTAIELKIKDNLFYQMLTDTQTTQEDKISQIADALDPRKQTMEKRRETFKVFQEYYT